MRRIALTLVVLGSAALTACSGGGSVLNFGSNSTPDHILVTQQGQTNTPRVIAGTSIVLSAQAVKGSQNGTISTNVFKWTAALVTSGTYPVNALGGTKPCATPSITIPPASAAAYAPDYTAYLVVVDPTNPANVTFAPPLTIPAPAGTTTGILAGSTATNAYCAVVNASTPDGLTTGSVIVAITSPQSPQQ
jgi:hypothetical protein